MLVQEPDFPPYINIKHSKRARRVALRLDTKARRFDLIVPPWMNLLQAQDFATDHDRWMQEKLSELPDNRPFEDGCVFPLCGRLITLEVERDATLRRTSITLEGRILRVRTYMADPSMRIIRFLKDHALAVMEPMVREKAAVIGKKVHSVTLRDPKSRWGSCSSDGKIMLSWRLILAPYEAMDYVIAHEVAHLKHMDHSDRFWSACEDLSDDYEEGHYWMRQHGSELMAYGA